MNTDCVTLDAFTTLIVVVSADNRFEHGVEFHFVNGGIQAVRRSHDEVEAVEAALFCDPILIF